MIQRRNCRDLKLTANPNPHPSRSSLGERNVGSSNGAPGHKLGQHVPTRDREDVVARASRDELAALPEKETHVGMDRKVSEVFNESHQIPLLMAWNLYGTPTGTSG